MKLQEEADNIKSEFAAKEAQLQADVAAKQAACMAAMAAGDM